jgi:hypothetical protein
VNRKLLSVLLAVILVLGLPGAARADVNTTITFDGCTYRQENYRPYGLYYAKTTKLNSFCLQVCARLDNLPWKCTTSGGGIEVWGDGPFSVSWHSANTFGQGSSAWYFF